jgi:hypothetical protein
LREGLIVEKRKRTSRPRDSAPDFLREIAIHEAGHAVIGRVLTLPCGHATIEADEDSSAHAITAEPWTILDHWEHVPTRKKRTARGWRGGEVRSVYIARALAYMAGREAEVVCRGHCRDGDVDDQVQINRMLAEVHIPGLEINGGAARERYEARLRRQARRLVRRHRALIKRVADELLKRGRLESKEIDTIIAGSTHRPGRA